MAKRSTDHPAAPTPQADGVQDSFPILATSSRAPDVNRVLKNGDTFAVLDRQGDIYACTDGLSEQGVYHQGTRFLSRFVLLLEEQRPIVLSSMVKEDNAFLVADLTNPDFLDENGEIVLLRDSIHIERTSLLWNAVLYTSLQVRNYARSSVHMRLTLQVAADYADIFEVRGSRRSNRGRDRQPEIEGNSVVLSYEGLDGIVRRTADRNFIESIWPNVELALRWISEYGDLDGDGFIEYQRVSKKGLVSQGWKDSFDAIFHADGSLAEGGIALCEVQAYCWAAQIAGAELAVELGLHERARELAARAEALRERFERVFWDDELSTYVLALDGQKRPCRVRTSNAGHVLFAGLADPSRAARTAETLMSSHSFSGWGVRTVASTESRYNPMAYHNGSVWPHDNAMIAFGMARYGLANHVLRILDGLFDASMFFELNRAPELFCGFGRRPGESPTLYPVACAPQAWAAAAVYMILRGCLGLWIDAPRRQIRFNRPILPSSLSRLLIRNLQVAGASVDLTLERLPGDVAVNLDRREGDVEILIMK